jgi:cell division protein FtsQ
MCLALLALGVLGYAGLYAVQSGFVDQIQRRILSQFYIATADAGFRVQNVIVKGRQSVERDVLKNILNVEKGEPIFSYNLADMAQNIESLTWVKNVRIERRLPDTLYIVMEERTPLALWQQGGRVVLVDGDGVILSDKNLKKFSDLMVIVGDEAPQKAGTLMSYLQAEQTLKAQVTGARWVGNRRWDLVLKSGAIVRLPEQDMGLAISRLAKAQKEDQLLSKKLETIDVRDPMRIVVQSQTGEAEKMEASFQADQNI